MWRLIFIPILYDNFYYCHSYYRLKKKKLELGKVEWLGCGQLINDEDESWYKIVFPNLLSVLLYDYDYMIMIEDR